MSTKAVIPFICGLGIIAIIENGTFDQMSQRHAQKVDAVIAQQQREAAAAQAAQQAAAEHARYLARYTDTSFTRQPGRKTIAIVVASENASGDDAVRDALVSHFKNEPVQLVSLFFTPAFVSDGLFNNAFADSNDLFNRLELSKSLDGLLLAREKVQYVTNPSSLDNVLTASMELDVITLTIGSHVPGQTWTFTSSGAGFKKTDARAQAEERIIKQIANDTKMSLN